jgi:hypothetical protein
METYSHVLHYDEAGRADALKHTIVWLYDWLQRVGIEPALHQGLVKYMLGRGAEIMNDVFFGENPGYQEIGISRDAIGWRRFIEDVISKDKVALQEAVVNLGRCPILLDK